MDQWGLGLLLGLTPGLKEAQPQAPVVQVQSQQVQ